MINIGHVFQEEARGLDWTVFRLGVILGGHDDESWKKDREDGPVFAGYVGHTGWNWCMKRVAWARWLVDCAEGGAESEWVCKMPAVSKSSLR